MTTEELQEKVVEAERHLNELVAEDTALDQEQQRIDSRIKYIYNRKRELRLGSMGFGSPTGLIVQAQTKLTNLRQAMLDSAQPQLVIETYAGKLAVVLSRVTPKQIYLRQAGHDTEFVVSKDGKKAPYNWKVDIEALKAFAEVKE